MAKNPGLKAFAEIFSSKKKYYLLVLSGIILFNCFYALFEGLSFAFILNALADLSSSGFQDNLIHRTLYKIAPQLQEFFQNRFSHFIFFLIGALCMQVCKSLSSFCATIIQTSALNKVQIGIIHALCKQILSFKFSFISNYKLGELIHAAKIPFEVLSPLSWNLNNLIQISLTFTVLFCLLLKISAPFTIVVGFTIPMIIFLQKALIKKTKKLSIETSENMSDYIKFFTQAISGIRVVTIFHRFAFVYRRINKIIMVLTRNWYHSVRSTNLIRPINEICILFLVGICAFLGFLFLKSQGESAISLLITYLFILMRMSNQIPALMTGIGQLALGWGDLSRIANLLSKENKEYAKDGSIELPPFHSKIEFKNIFHSYKNDLPVLYDISFEVNKGQTIAFVGKSGAGKSTIVDLLLKLYEPQNGEISIDNIPLKDISLKTWRDQVGVVSQDVFIFNDSIYENICFGLEDVPLEEVENAAYIAGCKEFIEHLPEKYDTFLGERGYRLSGGEKQRISLARALLKNPNILILDEATSALDTYTEKFILETLEQFQGKKTLLIIAHRLSTIMHSDQIIVIERGRILEKGNHEDLLQANSHYAHMWMSQQKSHRKTPKVLLKH